MQVVLLQKVKDLGETGDIVEVAKGFAANFLLPQKKADLATSKTLLWAEKIRAERIAKKEEIIKRAQAFATKLEKITLTFFRKTTKEDGEHLFGAVTEKDIIEKLKIEAKIELEKKQIKMPHHFKKIGEYEVEVHLAEDVNIKIKVEIKPEKK